MSVEKRGDKWVAVVELGRGPDGRRQRRSITCDTQRAALKAEAIARGKAAQGKLSKDSAQTVAHFLDDWLAIREHEVAPATYAADYSRCQRFKRAYGSTRLCDLTGHQVRRFEGTLYKRGLSDSTVRKYRMCIQGALTDALQGGIIDVNPAQRLGPLPENNPEVRWLTAAEQVALLGYARSGFKGRRSRLYELVVMAIGTGMRQGELLALRWGDIDWKRSVVHMRRSLQWTVDAKTQKITGHRFKTHGKSGSRTVPLPESLAALLAQHRQERAAQLRLAGIDSDLIFCGDDGQPMGKNGLRSGFRYLVAKAGLPPEIHFHCLRHTFATEMLEAGVHPKVVAAWIGDSERTLMKTYAHATPSMQEQAVVVADRHLRGLLGTPESGTAL